MGKTTELPQIQSLPIDTTVEEEVDVEVGSHIENLQNSTPLVAEVEVVEEGLTI